MTANKLEGKARDMHSCSYYCDRPDCVKAQRDQLREAHVTRQSEGMVFGVTKVERDFRWDGEKQHHVPLLTVEFEPAPSNVGFDSKGWKDRDALAELLAAAPADAGEGKA